jgi:hypothetical protein
MYRERNKYLSTIISFIVIYAALRLSRPLNIAMFTESVKYCKENIQAYVIAYF